MTTVLAVAAIVALLFALRDEFRAGGSLQLVGDDPTGGIIDLPRSGSWSDDDVLRTFAEIVGLPEVVA